jgi:hypothetical protein
MATRAGAPCPAKAEDLLEGQPPVRSGHCEGQGQGCPGVIGQGSPTHRRTRLAPAHLDPEGVRRGVRRSKVSTPLNIGAREVELACDEANGTRVDKPEPLLEGVQHRQQWSAYRRVGPDRRQGHLLGPGGYCWSLSIVGTSSAGRICSRTCSRTRPGRPSQVEGAAESWIRARARLPSSPRAGEAGPVRVGKHRRRYDQVMAGVVLTKEK